MVRRRCRSSKTEICIISEDPKKKYVCVSVCFVFCPPHCGHKCVYMLFLSSCLSTPFLCCICRGWVGGCARVCVCRTRSFTYQHKHYNFELGDEIRFRLHYTFPALSVRSIRTHDVAAVTTKILYSAAFSRRRQ